MHGLTSKSNFHLRTWRLRLKQQKEPCRHRSYGAISPENLTNWRKEIPLLDRACASRKKLRWSVCGTIGVTFVPLF